MVKQNFSHLLEKYTLNNVRIKSGTLMEAFDLFRTKYYLRDGIFADEL